MFLESFTSVLYAFVQSRRMVEYYHHFAKIQPFCNINQRVSRLSQRGNGPFVYRDHAGWPASLPYIWKIRVNNYLGVVLCVVIDHNYEGPARGMVC